jgi:membrane-bound lytic murein transglycosylase MltF
MKNQITYVKDVRILKETAEPDLMAIKARGIASLKKLVAPVLVPRNYDIVPSDGIYELDFTLDEAHEDYINVELEVEVVFRVKNLPDWVRGVKINAAENSDIELL